MHGSAVFSQFLCGSETARGEVRRQHIVWSKDSTLWLLETAHPAAHEQYDVSVAALASFDD